jgi:hypothetical protein
MALNASWRRPIGQTVRLVIKAERVEMQITDAEPWFGCTIGDVAMTIIAQNAHPESAEAHFASVFTANYQAIAAVFPEFARLSELAKLSHICDFLAQLCSKAEAEIALTDARPSIKMRLEAILTGI